MWEVPSPHLRNNKLAGDQQSPQQVVSAVIPHLIDGHLKTNTLLNMTSILKEGCGCVFALTCEPVRMMGLPKCSHMKDRAEAV